MAAAAVPSGLELSLLVTLAASLALVAMLVLRAAGGLFGLGTTSAVGTAGDRPTDRAVSAVLALPSQTAAFFRGSLQSLAKAFARARASNAPRLAVAVLPDRSAAYAAPAPAITSGMPVVPSEGLTREAQWARLDAIATRSVDAARMARRAHTTAAAKLDAADYQLERLLAEIAPVMRTRPRPASVAAFPAPKSRAAGSRAMDADRVAA